MDVTYELGELGECCQRLAQLGWKHLAEFCLLSCSLTFGRLPMRQATWVNIWLCFDREKQRWDTEVIEETVLLRGIRNTLLQGTRSFRLAAWTTLS